MPRPNPIIVGGRALSGARLVELRKQQLEAWRAEQCRQLALFELKDDTRRQRSELRLLQAVEVVPLCDGALAKTAMLKSAQDLPPRRTGFLAASLLPERRRWGQRALLATFRRKNSRRK